MCEGHRPGGQDAASPLPAPRPPPAPTPPACPPLLQVLDYDNVQQTLLPLLARAYSLVFMVRPPGLGLPFWRPCLIAARALPPGPCLPTPNLSPSSTHPHTHTPRTLPSHPTHPPPPPTRTLPLNPRPPPPPQGRSMMDMYNSFDAARSRGDFGVLPELHALSSGLKALCTDITAAGIEACRRQCGGHGYMLASGLPTLFNSYVQK